MSVADELRRHLARVGPRTRFPTVDEIDAEVGRLGERFAGVARVERPGSARSGHPLQMLSIGAGERHAVVVAMSHPNEPTGALGALALAELLADDTALRDALGLVWHILPCADPDGTRLNERWFAGPYDRATYANGFYRPPFPEQVEWTFRMPDCESPGQPSLPESRVLMAVIDAVRPELLVSMHDAEVGGLFCYVTADLPGIGEAMPTIREAAGLPAYLGEPEGPADVRAPGVFRVPPSVGGAPMLCSTDYAARHGGFGIVTEPPIWADVRAADSRLTGFTRADTHARFAWRCAELAAEHAGWLAELNGTLTLRTSLHRAVEDDADALSNGLAGCADAGEEPSTVAYASSLAARLHLHRLRAAGHLAGALSAELAGGNGDEAVRRLLAKVERRIAEWGAEADDASARFVGTSGAVQAHVGLALASASALR